jgi:hypothetical protein
MSGRFLTVIEINKEKIFYNKNGFCCLIVDNVNEELMLRDKIFNFRIPERAAK